MAMMHNPPHPGELLRHEVIVALGLSVTEAASRLAMSRVALSRVLNDMAGISPDLALRLEQAGASTARAPACAARCATVAGSRLNANPRAKRDESEWTL